MPLVMEPEVSVVVLVPRRETIEVPDLGQCTVRGLRLSERLALGASEENDYAHIANTLHWCVIDPDDGRPRYEAEEWEALGGTYPQAALELFLAVQRLSTPEKKTETDPISPLPDGSPDITG